MHKAAFVKQLRTGFVAQGWEPLTGPSGAAMLFWRRWNDLAVTLGVDYPPSWKTCFHVSYYVGRTFSWAMAFPDIGESRHYLRVLQPLNAPEHAELERCPGWCPAGLFKRDEHGVDIAQAADRLAFPRFLTEDLYEAVCKSVPMRQHASRIDGIIARARATPAAPVGPPPEEWVVAAHAEYESQNMPLKRPAALMFAMDAIWVHRLLRGGP